MSSPRAIGPYAVTGVLGEGGMGVVYRARHPKLPIEVAVKVLKASALDDEALARFRAEVLALARVKHENVVPVLDAGRAEDGSPYYVMPLVAGRSLDGILSKEGPLEPRRAAGLVAKVARAVHTAHVNAAVVHRDLKPSNVLVEDSTGEPKLFDFGVAKASHEGEALTQTGVVVGTPEYMSPEQASGENALVDARTDVYGLGAILYALLTGRAPFERKGRSAALLIADVCLKEPPSPASLRQGLPRDVVAICRQAIAKERERRYASALDLALDLERFAAGEPVLARPPGLGARLGRLLARHKAAVAVTGALVLAASGVAVEEAIRALHFANRLAIPAGFEMAHAKIAQGAYVDTGGRVHGDVDGAREDLARVCSLARGLPDEGRGPVLADAARGLMALNLPAEARALLERASSELPRSLELLDARHDLLHRLREPCRELRGRIREVAHGRDGARAFELVLDAEDALDRHDVMAAMRSLDAALGGADPLPRGAHALRGRLAVADPRAPSYLRAAVELTQATFDLPGDPTVLADLARSLGRAEETPEAIAAAKRAIERDGRQPRAWETLADAALLLGDWREAEADIHSWSELEPGAEPVLLVRARLFLLSHRDGEALAEARAILGRERVSTGARAFALAVEIVGHFRRSERTELEAATHELQRVYESELASPELKPSVDDRVLGARAMRWALSTLCRVHLDDGDMGQAQQVHNQFSSLRNLDPSDPYPLVEMAECAARFTPVEPANVEVYVLQVRDEFLARGVPVPVELEERLKAIESRLHAR